jgi:anti-sigma factor RsiW
MLMCRSAESLIVEEADGLLAPPERDLLDRHTAECRGCRARRESNLAVKAVLARRVDAAVPAAFAARVGARAGSDVPDGWLSGVDWRRWTEWLLPVAAGLALLVLLVGGVSPGTSTGTGIETADSELAVMGETDLTAEGQALTPDMTSEELLAAMLGAAQGASDGR